MTSIVTVRMDRNQRDKLNAIAKARRVSVSQLFRDQIERYVRGEITLVKPDPDILAKTTLVIEPEQAEQVRELAEKQGLKRDTAFRLLLEEVVNGGK